nr:GGDEF domain-containing protein [Curvibacter sp. CHRR-16]
MVLQWVRIRSSARHYEHVLRSEIALQESRREIERLSSHDNLTGLCNRRGLETTLYSQWHLAARQQGAVSLIALDLDHIKRVNERLGHGAGDACLRHVAQLLRSQFRRSSDLVARMGGDSFAVLLPQTDAIEAMRLARDLRDQLMRSSLEWNGQSLNITASMGVDCARWDMDLSPDDTLKRITAACHEAKTKGRNRVLQA